MAVGQILQMLFEFALIHNILCLQSSRQRLPVFVHTSAGDLLVNDRAWRHDWLGGCRLF